MDAALGLGVLVARRSSERRFVVPAAVLVAATAAFHFETGYLAFLGVAVFVLVRPSELCSKGGPRGLLVVGGAVGWLRWVIVPLIAQGKWAAINQFLQSGPEGVDANSYGARRVLSLARRRRPPRLAPPRPASRRSSASGLSSVSSPGDGRSAATATRARARPGAVGLFVTRLVLFFGRPTLGTLLDLLPGRRTSSSAASSSGSSSPGSSSPASAPSSWQLGLGCACERLVGGDSGLQVRAGGSLRRSPSDACAWRRSSRPWSFVVTRRPRTPRSSREQSSASAATHAARRALSIESPRVAAAGPSPATHLTGDRASPSARCLSSSTSPRDVDEVGFTLRTASLMSGPENEFDDTIPADYALFGIRWLLLPGKMQPPVPATSVERRGPYALWDIPGNGYTQVVDTRGSVAASSGDLGSFSAAFLACLPATHPIYPTVAYEGAASATGHSPRTQALCAAWDGARRAGRPRKRHRRCRGLLDERRRRLTLGFV